VSCLTSPCTQCLLCQQRRIGCLTVKYRCGTFATYASLSTRSSVWNTAVRLEHGSPSTRSSVWNTAVRLEHGSLSGTRQSVYSIERLEHGSPSGTRQSVYSIERLEHDSSSGTRQPVWNMAVRLLDRAPRTSNQITSHRSRHYRLQYSQRYWSDFNLILQTFKLNRKLWRDVSSQVVEE